VTNEYDGTVELGFAWEVPLVSIAWPDVPTADGRPIVSDRDQGNPSVRDLVGRLRAT
jgi:dTDP-4-dehydrorhamnose 3,5-epimerase-like enzyme